VSRDREGFGKVVEKPSNSAFGADASQGRTPNGTLIKGYGDGMDAAHRSRILQEEAWKRKHQDDD